MKQKRNRERIMEQSMYDLLCAMNENHNPLVTGHCVMRGFIGETAQFERCKKYKAHCNQCIQNWLNEYPF